MNTKLGFAGLILACSACCVPLLVPLLAASGAAIGLAAGSLDAALCIVVPAFALAGGGTWLALRKHRRTNAGCGCKDNCKAVSNFR